MIWMATHMAENLLSFEWNSFAFTSGSMSSIWDSFFLYVSLYTTLSTIRNDYINWNHARIFVFIVTIHLIYIIHTCNALRFHILLSITKTTFIHSSFWVFPSLMICQKTLFGFYVYLNCFLLFFFFHFPISLHNSRQDKTLEVFFHFTNIRKKIIFHFLKWFGINSRTTSDLWFHFDLFQHSFIHSLKTLVKRFFLWCA